MNMSGVTCDCVRHAEMTSESIQGLSSRNLRSPVYSFCYARIRGRRGRKLLDDLKERTGYSLL